MPRFQYRALSPTGEIVAGELDGPDSTTIIERLHDQALMPIDAVEERARPRRALEFRLYRRHSVRPSDLALLTQQLSRLLKAGLPLDRALEILANLAVDKRSGRAVRGTLQRVRDGAGLAEALAAQPEAFPQAYVSMVRAGEEGGALPPVLARLADFLGRSEANRQKIASALIYPAILVVVAALSVALVLTVVLPQFAPLFEQAGARLPASTRVVMTLGDGLREAWWMVLLAIAAAGLTGRQLLQRPAIAIGRDRLVLASPLAGDLARKFEIARFARTLGALLSNGVPAPRALALSGATIGNRVIAGAVETVATRFKEGEGLSAPLSRTGQFPRLAIQLIHIGEETGRLDEMLAEIAEIYDEEVERAMQRLIAVLVPAITIAMGSVIALIIVAVMTAMIGINDLAL
jgi:general secretion pathway protein F